MMPHSYFGSDPFWFTLQCFRCFHSFLRPLFDINDCPACDHKYYIDFHEIGFNYKYILKVICCNPDCGWTGKKSQCVTMKHGDDLLCPECHEVVEEQ